MGIPTRGCWPAGQSTPHSLPIPTSTHLQQLPVQPAPGRPPRWLGPSGGQSPSSVSAKMRVPGSPLAPWAPQGCPRQRPGAGAASPAAAAARAEFASPAAAAAPRAASAVSGAQRTNGLSRWEPHAPALLRHKQLPAPQQAGGHGGEEPTHREEQQQDAPAQQGAAKDAQHHVPAAGLRVHLHLLPAGIGCRLPIAAPHGRLLHAARGQELQHRRGDAGAVRQGPPGTRAPSPPS